MELQSAVELLTSKIENLATTKGSPVLIALDGRSGTGKSTLASAIAKRVDGVVVVSDDFYSGGNDEKWETSSPQEKAENAIDWRRMRTQVLEPLLAGRPASWHPLAFDPGVGWTGWKDELVTLMPAKVIILDGAYSTRTEMGDIIDLKILVEAPDKIRRERLRKREGEVFMKRWHAIWDSAEDYYFSKQDMRHRFDLMISLG